MSAQVLLLRYIWDLPGPEIEPVSPALQVGVLTTGPPGSPQVLPYASDGGLVTMVV